MDYIETESSVFFQPAKAPSLSTLCRCNPSLLPCALSCGRAALLGLRVVVPSCSAVQCSAVQRRVVILTSCRAVGMPRCVGMLKDGVAGVPLLQTSSRAEVHAAVPIPSHLPLSPFPLPLLIPLSISLPSQWPPQWTTAAPPSTSPPCWLACGPTRCCALRPRATACS